MKLNAIEMAKINGGDDDPTSIKPDGSCTVAEDCGCAQNSQSKSAYTTHRNNADSAWGA